MLSIRNTNFDITYFRNIEGYENLYMISNVGEVLSLRNGILLSQAVNMGGYKQVMLVDKYSNRKNKLVHRLVAKAFLTNPKNKKFINHKNSIRTDNHANNLEWCTSKENMQHASRNNRLTNHTKKRQEYYDKLKRKIKLVRGNEEKHFNSLKEASKFLNCEVATISMHLNNKEKRKTVKGWIGSDCNS